MENKTCKNNTALLMKLISLHIPNHLAEAYMLYIQRILSSNLSQSPSLEISSFLQQTKRRVSDQANIKLSNLCSILSTSSKLNKPKEVLNLLLKLSDFKTEFVPGNPILSLSKQIPHAQTIEKIDILIASKPSFEALLIRDILYAFQGTEGKYLTYSRLDDRFAIRQEIPESIKYVAESLAELGWLYKKIDKFLKNNEEFPSIICQSFCSSLKVELKEYFRFIALLETQTTAKLKIIEMWTMEPLERMRWIALICEAVEGLKGGNFISAVYSYCKYGDPGIQVLVCRILDSVSQPFLEMIEKWMLDGELTDVFHEFFVEENIEISEDKLWTEKYKLIKDLVPGFFLPEIVEKIFITGKSINFLRRCCQEEWKSETPLDLPKLRDIQAVKTWVERAAEATNAQLIGILFSKYRLLDHAKCIRKYMLLAQGDFHHYLMDQLNDVLNEPARKIHKHNLVSILENAFRASNVQNEDWDLLNKLSSTLEEYTTLDLGWDVFILRYQVDAPLNTIFNEQSMKQYTKIFKLFWKIKRVYFYMNSYTDCSEMLQLQQMKDVRYILHKSQMLKLEIMHFINNLYHYLMVEVQENAWNWFQKSLENVEDLDKLIEIHQQFLDTILERAFLNLENEKVYKRLLKILELASRFKMSQETLISSAIDELSRRNKSENDDQPHENVEFYNLSRLSIESIHEIERIKLVYAEEIQLFRKSLSDANKAHLRFLAFRLDFNEFYTIKNG